MIANQDHAKTEQLVLMVLVHAPVFVYEDLPEKIAESMKITAIQTHATMEVHALMALTHIYATVQGSGLETFVTKVSINI